MSLGNKGQTASHCFQDEQIQRLDRKSPRTLAWGSEEDYLAMLHNTAG